jgi:hypothetical protein
MARALLSPPIDVAFLGIVPLALPLAAAASPVPLSASQALVLVSLFSFPHFAGSYFVFYGMQGPWRRHLAIALALPALLVALTAAAMQAPPLLTALVHGVLVLLYWHYAKQAFGISLWLGRRDERPVSRRSREALLFACLLLGTLGLFRAHAASGSFAVFGVYVEPAGVPDLALQGVRALAWLTVFGLVLWSLLGAERGAPRAAGLLPVLALLSWSDPALGSPSVLALLPVFHGAQYLAFPMRVTWKRLAVETHAQTWIRFLTLWVLLIGVGYALFRGLPAALTAWSTETPWAAAVLITLNVHHYFVDSVLWRFRAPEVAQRL